MGGQSFRGGSQGCGPPRADEAVDGRQAEAERERRAKVINAEGEFQAADKLRQAAEIMTPYPMAMQMRYLQALADVASDQNSTIIFPLPIELLAPFLKAGRKAAARAG